jgi:hypothetical protein
MRNALIAILICASVEAARAEVTGNDLKEYCQFYPRQTQATALCMGYISGALDAARLFNPMLGGQMVCEPSGVTGDQLIALTIKYLADHPEELHLVAGSLIVDMYIKTFPCRKRPG